MKKYKIDDTNATLLKSIDKKMIRKKKIRGICAYPRIVPENVTLKVLKTSNVKHPKFIKNRFRYVYEEFIEGKSIHDIDKNYLSGIFCNYLYEMNKLDITPLKKYSKWVNNTSFLHYQINNLLIVVRKSEQVEKLKQLGINFNLLLSLKNKKLDDNRKQFFIHGNLTKDNLIDNSGQFTLIDWELACHGDVAYELALLFVVEEYSEENIKVVIDRLCGSLLLEQSTLERDVRVYMQFEYYRRSIVGFIEAINCYKSRKPNEILLDQTYKYYKNLSNTLTLENIKRIINN